MSWRTLLVPLGVLTHWRRVTHICVGNLTIIGSDNGFSPGRRQAITWTNVGILLIWPIGTYFSEMSIEIHTFSFNKIHLKMSSGKWRPFCLGLNVLIQVKDDVILVIYRYGIVYIRGMNLAIIVTAVVRRLSVPKPSTCRQRRKGTRWWRCCFSIPWIMHTAQDFVVLRCGMKPFDFARIVQVFFIGTRTPYRWLSARLQ